MNLSAEIDKYKKIQNIALNVLFDIKNYIRSGITEHEIAMKCVMLLENAGITECWYHNVPAFVLIGKRTTLSISGRDYAPTELCVQEKDLVTIDLSPVLDGYWGDCARSYVVESGCVSENIQDQALKNGIEAEKKLHEKMFEIANPKMTMHELYLAMNAKITEMGFLNLDFHQNLGHSIEKQINNRRYLEKDNNTRLGDVSFFTFEPHIQEKNGIWGFKRENIYYFENDKLITLGSPMLLDF